ncbi:2-dehydro-3-deoxygluconokinase [Klenkia marina]|uniref:2-dehydro-3-deoxygluconokinase n=1 Tax=Klenkia marina TaxID=1960309 RepID=A0A1G4XUU2_9ACTN|nr:sugar kinase [Klenkia marina]SCX44418.1 2-dehydro-3-deoxygluconokinase [Klenkia marina]
MTGVVTVGETMALLTTPPTGRLTAGSVMPVGIGGAESNVAVGLVRLGVPATWVSRVGDDAFGALVLRELRAEGVTVRAEVDPDAPTGLMVKELRGGRPRRVRYHRAGSAASRLTPADVDRVAEDIRTADALHLTGITPALGPGPAAAVDRAVELARAAGVAVVLDVNHRTALWSDEVAAPVLADLARRVDVLLAGPDEAALLLGGPVGADVEAGLTAARALVRRGTGTVVVKLAGLGAVEVGGGREVHGPTTPVEVVDPVGAGDAFAAGWLAASVAGGSAEERLALGNAAGGAVCRVPGDWEGLPTRAELAETGPMTEVRR